MSADWKTVTLGEVAEFVRGINFKPDDVVRDETDSFGAPGLNGALTAPPAFTAN